MQRSPDTAGATADKTMSPGWLLGLAPGFYAARRRINSPAALVDGSAARARNKEAGGAARALLALGLLLCALAGGLSLDDEAPRLKRQGFAANSVRGTELAELMEEPPGGHNAGHASSADPNLEGRQLPLAAADQQAREFVVAGGWSIDTGGNTHRGVLRGDEHVDQDALRRRVEAGLGFTIEQVRSVYRQGRLSAEQGELRARIDARLLALSRSGANMTLLGRLLGLEISTNGCQPIIRALRRAREAE